MNRRIFRVLAALFALSLVAAACGDDDDDVASSGESTTSVDEGSDEMSDDEMDDETDEMSDEPSVEIASPADGAEVTSPVTIEMVAHDFTIEPAGEVVDGAGHFHVMVDVGCVEAGEVIPGDTEGYNHFGKAQLEAELELEPGEHTICLQVGDGVHTALDLTHEITITVVE